LNSNQEYPATPKASDSNLDLAILKVGGDPDLPAAELGNSSDIIVGEEVITAGFPLGQDLPGPVSFSQGIISALRTLNNKQFIQTDSTINPGNSGGALARKLDAKIIGIITAKVAPQGQVVENIGLAIPIDVIRTYLDSNLG
jgi:S1-C subfamily serine protease